VDSLSIVVDLVSEAQQSLKSSEVCLLEESNLGGYLVEFVGEGDEDLSGHLQNLEVNEARVCSAYVACYLSTLYKGEVAFLKFPDLECERRVG